VTALVPVYVYADDPISQIGVSHQLAACPGLQVTEDVDRAVVAVVVIDEIDEQALGVIQAMPRNGCPRVVVVVSRLDDAGLLGAVEAGASGILRRASADAEALVEAVETAAAGNGSVPSDLLGGLLAQVGRLQRQVLAPRGLMLSGLTEREAEVLRLVSEGYDTAEIAERLCYSERTVKNVIHDVTSRLGLRNRSHAVAYALREGLI
jgi:DNA-binding NarL/FixJ family response regulator